MFEPAPAKINLTLLVTGRRADGYHLLDSIVVFAGAHDRLLANPSNDLSLELTGPFAAGLSAEPDNLVLRAARALARAAGVHAGARLTLEKYLPIASGIGGGSADAAAALRLLGRLWGVQLQPEDLQVLAGTLGADVPVCLGLQPARMEGIGEILSASPSLPACGIVLVNPGIALATAAVFRARAGDFRARVTLPPAWNDLSAMVADLAVLGNDLEAPAVGLCPEIGGVLKALRARNGCRLARMSGSGATCFGLFDTAADAEAVTATLARPGWWCWGGGLW